jgi:hypothetical protein
MREYEKPVFEEFEKFANVVETWAVYDTIIVCKEFYGSEANAPGWFTSFVDFGSRETHSFFKTRTDSVAGEQYCNLKASDVMNFAFKIHSLGLEVTGIPTTDLQQTDVDGFDITKPDQIVSQWWAADFPRHAAIQLKVQQDIRVELPAMGCPPGYGALGAGVAFGHTDAVAPAYGDIPFMTNATVQGVPLLSNRYPLPEPIGVPRTGNVEGILHVSEWARYILRNITGPHEFVMNSDSGTPSYRFFESRYMIRFSLFGERLVQQRAQYHR